MFERPTPFALPRQSARATLIEGYLWTWIVSVVLAAGFISLIAAVTTDPSGALVFPLAALFAGIVALPGLLIGMPIAHCVSLRRGGRFSGISTIAITGFLTALFPLVVMAGWLFIEALTRTPVDGVGDPTFGQPEGTGVHHIAETVAFVAPTATVVAIVGGIAAAIGRRVADPIFRSVA